MVTLDNLSGVAGRGSRPSGRCFLVLRLTCVRALRHERTLSDANFELCRSGVSRLLEIIVTRASGVALNQLALVVGPLRVIVAVNVAKELGGFKGVAFAPRSDSVRTRSDPARIGSLRRISAALTTTSHGDRP